LEGLRVKEAGSSSIGRAENRSSFQVEEFYRRWKAPVFTFCCLFLGDQYLAGDATSRAFLSFYRQHRELEGDQLPPPLIGAARTVVYRLASLRSGPAVVTRAAGDAQPLTDAILNLAADERTVFILRTVLNVDSAAISAATGLPLESVHELWRSALRMLGATLVHPSSRTDKTLGRTPSSLHTAIQQPEPAAKAAECTRGNQRQDGDGSAWTGSRQGIARTLKCGM
jgi:DNA-directed RNA polymerase specialized sigma24 family protein